MTAAMAACLAGCFHHQAYLPGVIDLRTDGSGLPTATRPPTVDPRQTRSGVEGYVTGEGLTVAGADVDVEDRHYWIAGLIPVINDSPTPEIAAALASSDALVQLEIREELDIVSVVGALIAQLVVPVTAWVAPPWSFGLHAKAVATRTGAPTGAASASAAPPLPAAAPPPTPPPAPAALPPAPPDPLDPLERTP